VKKSVVDEEICDNDFKKCLSTQKSLSVKQNIFRTKNHDICIIEQNKTALSAHDDKRFILENGINTLAWDHYKTEIPGENFVDHINNLIKTNNSKNCEIKKAGPSSGVRMVGEKTFAKSSETFLAKFFCEIILK
jgi:hypothetical protein